MNEGVRALSGGDLETSLKKLTEVTKLDGRNSQAWFLLGVSKHRKKDLAGAEDAYKKCISINPKLVDAQCNLANILNEYGRYNEAENIYLQAAGIAPRHPDVHFNYGVMLSKLERHADAAAAFRNAILYLPDYGQAYNWLAASLVQLGAHKDALVAIEQACRLIPSDIEFHLLKARIQRSLTFHDAAQSSLKQCISIQAKTAQDRSVQAVALLRLGNISAAFDAMSFLGFPKYSEHSEFSRTTDFRSNFRNLPDMKVLKQKNRSPEKLIMVSGDKAYIDRFFPKFLKSADYQNPSISIHLHGMLSSEEECKAISELVSDRVSVSYEIYIPTDKTGYTTRRFIRLMQFLNFFKTPMFCMDIDSMLQKDFDPLFKILQNTDIGIYRRQDDPIFHQLIHAAIFYASPTPGALRFLNFFARYVHYLEIRGNLRWFSDQLALLAADEWFKRRDNEVSVTQLDREVMTSATVTEKTYVLSFKGSQKDHIG
jgi:tetratricopeptide (TPR) repeat protein